MVQPDSASFVVLMFHPKVKQWFGSCFSRGFRQSLQTWIQYLPTSSFHSFSAFFVSAGNATPSNIGFIHIRTHLPATWIPTRSTCGAIEISVCTWQNRSSKRSSSVPHALTSTNLKANMSLGCYIWELWTCFSSIYCVFHVQNCWFDVFFVGKGITEVHQGITA